MTIPKQDHARFRELVDAARGCVVTTHMNPDGDAIGSQVSLARFLVSRGKQVRLVNQDPTPAILRFLEPDTPPIETYRASDHDAVLRDSDLVVLVDNSAPDRFGGMESIMVAVADHTLCIDHHPARQTPWAHRIMDEDACATTVMIYDLTLSCGWTPDLASAEALYVGLATDTGFFRFNSTTARGYEVGAELLRIGVTPARVYQAIYERNSLAYTRLLGHALAGVQLAAGGAVVSVKITRRMIEQVDAEEVDTSEYMTALLAMDGVAIALLFRELKDGRIKVSLRSKGQLDVRRLAAEFGGGGHPNASGIVMPGQLDEVERLMVERARRVHGGSR